MGFSVVMVAGICNLVGGGVYLWHATVVTVPNVSQSQG